MVTLTSDFEVCKEGNTLTSEQAKILELMDYRLATFKLQLKACWIKGEGFERLQNDKEGEEEVCDQEMLEDET